MTKITIYLLFTILSLSSFAMFNPQPYPIPKSEQRVNSLLNKIASSIEKKYEVRTIGNIVAMPSGNVKELGLSFTLQGPTNREEIRKILIEIAQEFLTFVNEDEAVRQYLSHYPFKICDIQIILFFQDKLGYGIRYPYITNAQISGGEIDYCILKDHYDEYLEMNIGKTVERYVETYEEALKAFHGYENE